MYSYFVWYFDDIYIKKKFYKIFCLKNKNYFKTIKYKSNVVGLYIDICYFRISNKFPAYICYVNLYVYFMIVCVLLCKSLGVQKWRRTKMINLHDLRGEIPRMLVSKNVGKFSIETKSLLNMILYCIYLHIWNIPFSFFH